MSRAYPPARSRFGTRQGVRQVTRRLTGEYRPTELDVPYTWKELFARQGRFGGGTTNFALVLATFGLVMPWQFGRAWVDSPMMLLYRGWVPLSLLSNMGTRSPPRRRGTPGV